MQKTAYGCRISDWSSDVCSSDLKLRLDGRDWRNVIIRIARTKTHFTDSLPLLAATGDAIADYLRHERPKTSNRAIFVRHVAPYDVPIKAGVAKHAVIAAFVRCGLIELIPTSFVTASRAACSPTARP